MYDGLNGKYTNMMYVYPNDNNITVKIFDSKLILTIVILFASTSPAHDPVHMFISESQQTLYVGFQRVSNNTLRVKPPSHVANIKAAQNKE